jgi:hypothetical protein
MRFFSKFRRLKVQDAAGDLESISFISEWNNDLRMRCSLAMPRLFIFLREFARNGKNKKPQGHRRGFTFVPPTPHLLSSRFDSAADKRAF